MKKKIFVTGAEGFIGSHLIESLVNKGFKVKACKTDVSNEEDVKNLITQTVADFGSVDNL